MRIYQRESPPPCSLFLSPTGRLNAGASERPQDGVVVTLSPILLETLFSTAYPYLRLTLYKVYKLHRNGASDSVVNN